VSGTILIYGATGYTGKLIAKAAADAGARPILAGRPPAARERAGTAKVRPSRRFSGTPMNACFGRGARLQESPREGAG
jgi:NAD(P)-dependent dehydrogenase (short-subunit alcohol dehydrogenase family)